MTPDKPQETQSKEPGVDPLLVRPGGLSYLEIPATDARQSAAFYERVLGWKVSGTDTDQPRFSDPAGHLIGKWIVGRTPSPEPGLLPYFYVEQLKDIIKRVLPYGGEIVKAVYREGTLWVAVIRDPAGNIIGLWQDSER